MPRTSRETSREGRYQDQHFGNYATELAARGRPARSDSGRHNQLSVSPPVELNHHGIYSGPMPSRRIDDRGHYSGPMPIRHIDGRQTSRRNSVEPPRGRARTPAPPRRRPTDDITRQRPEDESKYRAPPRQRPPDDTKYHAPPRRQRQHPPAETRHWTPEMDAVARRTMRQASGYAWMYEHMASNAKKWSGILSLISGALGGIVGTSGLISVFSETQAPMWVGITEAAVGYIIGLASFLGASWRLGDTQMNAILTQVSYSTMARDLMYQLAVPKPDRQDALEYVKTKLGEIEQLKVSAPIINGGARAAYKKKFKNNPIFSPEDDWTATLADVHTAYETLPVNTHVSRNGFPDDWSESPFDGDDDDPYDTGPYDTGPYDDGSYDIEQHNAGQYGNLKYRDHQHQNDQQYPPEQAFRVMGAMINALPQHVATSPPMPPPTGPPPTEAQSAVHLAEVSTTEAPLAESTAATAHL